MSYLARLKEREQAKTHAKAPATEPTKPPKPGYVGFVSTDAALLDSQFSAPAANHTDTEPAPDLPLQAAIVEFGGLCDRLGLRRNLSASPDAILEELPRLRRQAASG